MKVRPITFFIVSSSNKVKCKRFTVSRYIVVAAVMFYAISILGFFRFAYLCGTIAISKVGFYFEQQNNRILCSQLEFCRKLISNQQKKLYSLIALEDELRTRFGLSEIDQDIRKAGIGGFPPPYEELKTKINEPPDIIRAVKIHSDAENLFRQTQLQFSLISNTIEEIKNKFTLWNQTPSIQPVDGRITSGFGYRIHPITGNYSFHQGIDISNIPWTPVYAAADGIVEIVDYCNEMGNMVKIKHLETGFLTVYAHLERADVVIGQSVKRGDLIGYVGSSGRTTGPHLHYEIHKHGVAVNPILFINTSDTIYD